jgi:hypothetical protein
MSTYVRSACAATGRLDRTTLNGKVTRRFGSEPMSISRLERNLVAIEM